MQTISGNFRIHRTKAANGQDAILLVPEGIDISLMYSTSDEDDGGPLSFHNDIVGGDSAPETYLTWERYPDNFIHFGPDSETVRTH